ncbi:MAG: PDZ domain-containing protein [Actinobacteria bacterium]|nr:PDZ domain-containing protein [Actinomycetota bacterium]
MSSDASAGRPGLAPRISRLWWATGPVLVVLVATITVLLARTVPYIVFMPGSATEVQPLITIEPSDGEPSFVEDSAGDILFTTVSTRFPTGFEVLYRLLDDRNDVSPSEPYLGSQTTEENRSFNLSLMTDSKDRAAKVAMERAGYTVDVTSTGAVIVNLDPSYPAASVLRPGDTVVGADGTEIETSDQLAEAILAHEPGDTMELEIERLGEEGTTTVEAELAENPEKAGRAQLGVSLQDRPKYDFPFEVAIDSGDVGGPSAGLAFTLALLDRLTPGEITGGTRVAVTGTIQLDASVGPVGGVKQKVEGALRAGATVFLVPTAEYGDAVAAADGRLEVHRVDSLDDALSVLESIGGDPVEPVVQEAA